MQQRKSDNRITRLIAAFAHGVALTGWLGLSIASLAAEQASGITAVPREGFNLLVRELASPTHAVLTLATPNHGWFAGTFTNLPIDQPVTFGFSMDGNDDYKTPADVNKWRGLRPVMSYADPASYSSYVGYTKRPDGRWVADDLFRTGAAADAGAGPAPDQQAVPPGVAAQFLASDGMSWYPWREVTRAHALTGVNIFRMTETFAQSTATMAMRVPYPNEYQQALLERLQAAQLPGVFIDTLGQTPGGHTLSVIRLEPPDPATAPVERPTILAYAREHATEPEGSWVVEGMLRWLLSDDPAAHAARQQYDWLLIPLLDPDDADRCVYTTANNFSNVAPVRPEAVAYATYLVNRVDAGHRLEVVINLHNVECTEGPNLFNPLVNRLRQQAITALDAELWPAAEAAGFTVGQPAWSMVGLANGRLSGWCYKVFRTLDLFYEVNGRAPTSRLSPRELRRLGAVIARHAAGIGAHPRMTEIRNEISEHLAQRYEQRARFWTQAGRDARTRTVGDLLVLGY